jgi:hypothetical protein
MFAAQTPYVFLVGTGYGEKKKKSFLLFALASEKTVIFATDI